MGKKNNRAGHKKNSVSSIKFTAIWGKLEKGDLFDRWLNECGCGFKCPLEDSKLARDHQCDPKAKKAAKRAMKEAKKAELADEARKKLAEEKLRMTPKLKGRKKEAEAEEEEMKMTPKLKGRKKGNVRRALF